MKHVKKLMLLMMAICILFPLSSLKAYASAGTISFSDPTVTVGEEVSVTVKVATTDQTSLGGVDLTLAYDASALQFKSGTSASGDSGTVRIAGVISDSKTTSLSYTLKFKSLKAGTSKITVSSQDIIDLDYKEVTLSKTGSSTITAKAASTTQASADCKLASLQISPGTLSPAFSATNIEYTATVSNDTTKLAVSATANDAKAAVTSVTGTKLSVGKNTVKVTVTAENGEAAAYVITVTRQAAEKAESSTQSETSVKTEDSTPTEEASKIEVTVGDATMYLSSDLPKDGIPSGFTKGSYTYEDNEVSILKSSEGSLLLFYLTDQKGENGAYYLYEESTDSFTKYVPLESSISLISVTKGDSVTVPDGYTETTVTINDTELTAYQNNTNTEIYLIYAMSTAGDKGFYLYDSTEGSLQRYAGLVSTESTDSTGESSSEDSETLSILQNQMSKLNSQYNTTINTRTGILFGFIAATAILLILVVNLLLKLHDKNEDFVDETVEDTEKEDLDYVNMVEKYEAKNTEEDFEELEKEEVKKTKKVFAKKEKVEKKEKKDTSKEEVEDFEENEELEESTKKEEKGKIKKESDFTIIDLDDEK